MRPSIELVAAHTEREKPVRTFIYSRVSTSEQHTDIQLQAIESRGYKADPQHIVTEIISGGVMALQRPEFSRMVDRMDRGDTLVVLKLDRLGRDNVDVQQTIKMLTEVKGIKVISLDLPVEDLSSPGGRLMLQVLASMAEFEKARIAERTREGVAKAKALGRMKGRPPAIQTTKDVQHCKAQGLSQSRTAKILGISLATVKRHWNSESLER